MHRVRARRNGKYNVLSATHARIKLYMYMCITCARPRRTVRTQLRSRDTRSLLLVIEAPGYLVPEYRSSRRIKIT